MRLTCITLVAACALNLAGVSACIGQPSRPAMDTAALYQQPAIDGTSLAFAYDKLTGITPDFRPYAERSVPVRNATAFDRDAVMAREVARYQAAFQSLDLAKVYVIRMRSELRQYDPTRGGYAMGLSEDAFIPVNDPGTYKQYGLQFRNANEVNFIPVGDPSAARVFAERTKLSMQGPLAGNIVLQMAFRLIAAPPALASGDTPMVRADVLAARVLNEYGATNVVYDFGLTPAAKRPQGGSEVDAGSATLKAADVQGLRLGMTEDEAQVVVSQGWATKRGSQKVGHVLWFNDLEARRGDWAVCGDVTNAFPDPMAFQTGAAPPAFKDCIGYEFARVGASNSPYGDRLGLVSAVQYLADGNVTSLRQALEAKFGKPTTVRDGGADLVWVGKDPAKPDGGSIRIEAKLGRETASARSRLVLQVTMAPYVDPTRPAPPPAQPAISGGPRL